MIEALIPSYGRSGDANASEQELYTAKSPRKVSVKSNRRTKKKKKRPKSSEATSRQPSANNRIPSVYNPHSYPRAYSCYTKGPQKSAEAYEPPVTEREWWRIFLRETPSPGHYDYYDFIRAEQLKRIQPTYNFAGQGRMKEQGVEKKGALLVPGLYEFKDFLQELSQKKATYSFKSSGRTRAPTGYQTRLKDKELKTSPCQYKVTDECIMPVRPGARSSFKSQSARFPSDQFRGKEGPPPGAYNPTVPVTRYEVSSSFRSSRPRFLPSHTKVPGPGTYDATTGQTGEKAPSPLLKMARMHGLYFRNAFER